MVRVIASLLPFSAGIALGCAPARSAPPGAGGDLVPLHVTAQSALREARETVVRTSAAWRAAWADLVGPASPPLDPPAVNFGARTVVVVALGQRPSAGHTVSIDSLEVREGASVVWYTDRRPGLDCLTASVLTYPAAAASIPESTRPVRFARQEEIVECSA